jgi:hypothetical protein
MCHPRPTTGKWLEARAKAQTSDVVSSLLGLRAKTAILLHLAPPKLPAGSGPGDLDLLGRGASEFEQAVDEIVGEEEIPSELVQVRLRLSFCLSCKRISAPFFKRQLLPAFTSSK